MTYKVANSNGKAHLMPAKLKDQIKMTFALRLRDAYGRSPQTPKGHGTYVWVRDRLAELGVDVTAETVRRWFAGMVMPRSDAMQALASVVGVHAGFLAHGTVGEDTKIAGADVSEIVYAEAESNRNAIAASYIMGRLGMMGLKAHHLGSSKIEVIFGTMRRSVINVVYGEIGPDNHVALDIPEPDRFTGTYQPLFIVIAQGGREPDVYFFSAHEASLLGEGKKSFKAGPEAMVINLQGKDVSVRSNKGLGYIVKVI